MLFRSTSVTGPLGIPQQDVFAPDIDLFGQKRLDDSFTASAGGLGANIFKDRGAIERADFSGPTASLIVPLDNAAGVDLDPTLTSVALDSPASLNQFVVKLLDTDPSGVSGVGVDDLLAGLVSANGGSAFTITQIDASNFANVPAGRVLVQNVDYTYAYNANTNEAIFTSVTVFPSEARYNIRVDATQIRDIAANQLQPNQLDGSTQFNILVTNGVNDPPMNNVPSGTTINENTVAVPTFAAFSVADSNALSISDPDAFISTNIVQVTLTATNGLITLPANFATLVTLTAGSGVNAPTVTFTGTLPNINAMLAGGSITANKLIFTPTLDYNSTLAGTLGNAVLQITTNDLGNFSASNPLIPMVDIDNILITVNPVNSTPSVTTPAAVVTNEDVAYTFTGSVVSVADAADGNVGMQQVTVSVTNGVLSLNPATVGVGSVLIFVTANDGINDALITFQGTLLQINAALDGLVYTPTPDFNGTAVLNVTVNDLGNVGIGTPAPLTANGQTIITVVAQNDPPVNLLNGSPTAFTSTILQALERTSYTFNMANGSLLSINDLDARDALINSGVIQVTLTATDGTLTLPVIAGLSFTVGSGTADTIMTFTGQIDAVNNRLNGLVFNPATTFTTADPLAGVFATVTIAVNDQIHTGAGGALTDTDTVRLNVQPLNDPPVISVTNLMETIDEDTPLVIGMATSNAITVAENALDPAPAGDFQVTITVANGELDLATTSGLLFTYSDIFGTGAGNGTDDVTMTDRKSVV